MDLERIRAAFDGAHYVYWMNIPSYGCWYVYNGHLTVNVYDINLVCTNCFTLSSNPDGIEDFISTCEEWHTEDSV